MHYYCHIILKSYCFTLEEYEILTTAFTRKFTSSFHVFLYCLNVYYGSRQKPYTKTLIFQYRSFQENFSLHGCCQEECMCFYFLMFK